MVLFLVSIEKIRIGVSRVGEEDLVVTTFEALQLFEALHLFGERERSLCIRGVPRSYHDADFRPWRISGSETEMTRFFATPTLIRGSPSSTASMS